MMTDEERKAWEQLMLHGEDEPLSVYDRAIIAADSELTALRAENERLEVERKMDVEHLRKRNEALHAENEQLKKAVEWVLTLGIADLEWDTWRPELRKRAGMEK